MVGGLGSRNPAVGLTDQVKIDLPFLFLLVECPELNPEHQAKLISKQNTGSRDGRGQVVKEGEETVTWPCSWTCTPQPYWEEMERDEKGVGCWHGYSDNTGPFQKLQPQDSTHDPLPVPLAVNTFQPSGTLARIPTYLPR